MIFCCRLASLMVMSDDWAVPPPQIPLPIVPPAIPAPAVPPVAEVPPVPFPPAPDAPPVAVVPPLPEAPPLAFPPVPGVPPVARVPPVPMTPPVPVVPPEEVKPPVPRAPPVPLPPVAEPPVPFCPPVLAPPVPLPPVPSSAVTPPAQPANRDVAKARPARGRKRVIERRQGMGEPFVRADASPIPLLSPVRRMCSERGPAPGSLRATRSFSRQQSTTWQQ